MATSIFVRGSTVFFDVVFKDEDGVVVNPAGATLTVEFPTGTCDRSRDSETLALTAGAGFDGGWGVEDGWDSRAAAAGLVYANARTDGNPPISSVDFEFKLSANAANNAANS